MAVNVLKSLATVGTGFEFRQGQETFFFSETSKLARGPPSLIYNRYRTSFAGVEWPGLEVYHSPESSDEVRNEWSCTSSHICVYGVDRRGLGLRRTVLHEARFSPRNGMLVLT